MVARATLPTGSMAAYTKQRLARCGLTYEDDDQGHDQGINSHGFGETEAQDHGCADGTFGVGVAANRLRRAPGADAEADARADATQANGETCCQQLGAAIRRGGLRCDTARDIQSF